MMILNFVFANMYKVAGACRKILEMCMYAPIVNTTGGLVIAANDIYGTIIIKDVDFHYPTKTDVEVARKVNI